MLPQPLVFHFMLYSGSSSSTATVTAQSVAEGEQVQQGTVITLTFVDNANAETGATAGG